MYSIYEESSPDFKAIFENTEGMRDPRDFIARLMAGLLSDKNFWKISKDWLNKMGVAIFCQKNL